MGLVQFFKNLVTPKPYVSPLAEHNREAREQMKPREDTRLGYFITNPEHKIILPVSVTKLRNALEKSQGRKPLSLLSDKRMTSCRRAFSDNNRLMEMPEIDVSDDGNIRLYEGNHRLKILEDMGKKTILVYFSASSKKTPEALSKTIETVMALIGDENATFSIEHGNHAYCHVDYDMDRGMAVHSLDVSYLGPYYAVNEPEAEGSGLSFPTRL